MVVRTEDATNVNESKTGNMFVKTTATRIGCAGGEHRNVRPSQIVALAMRS